MWRCLHSVRSRRKLGVLASSSAAIDLPTSTECEQYPSQSEARRACRASMIRGPLSSAVCISEARASASAGEIGVVRLAGTRPYEARMRPISWRHYDGWLEHPDQVPWPGWLSGIHSYMRLRVGPARRGSVAATPQTYGQDWHWLTSLDSWTVDEAMEQAACAFGEDSGRAVGVRRSPQVQSEWSTEWAKGTPRGRRERTGTRSMGIAMDCLNNLA
ncbi:hypothetical protein Purlil1_8105 [Purpureocillium lilacinum]|uniref:Uncharacterized protein n=1 Tax=Purpureocillium lilacinum TaxID=33203 RepID=A0ABR0BU34_PURLI|nr:hypothetical protein Purlil1_8105 [Purpureocillium lilacinum]